MEMYFYLVLNPSYTQAYMPARTVSFISPNRTSEICRINNNYFFFPSFFPPDSMKDSLSVICSVLSLLEGGRAQPLFIILCVLSPML